MTRDDRPRIGKYYADYSELTPEELAMTDPEADTLIAKSRVVKMNREQFRRGVDSVLTLGPIRAALKMNNRGKDGAS